MPISRALIASLAVLVLTAAAAAQSSSPDPNLARWIGTWHSTGHFLDTSYSKLGDAVNTTACSWSALGQFLVCDQTTEIGGGTDRALSVYRYDASKQKYIFANVPGDGSSPRTPGLAIAGDLWTYSSSFQDKGATVTIRTVNTWKGSDRVDFLVEFSTDGKTWTTMGSGSSQRAK